MQHSSGIVKNHWTKNEALPSSLPTKTASLPLCFYLFETYQRKGGDWEEGERESNGERELGWDEGGGWGAAFGPSFTLSALLAGDSVQDLLITTQWSSNPTDLIDSDCCLGLSALPNPPSMPSLPLYLSQSLVPSPPSLIKHWYAWRPRGPMKEGCWEDWRDGSGGIKSVYTATGNSWQGDGCLDTRRGPEVSMSCRPPDRSVAFCLAKTDESTTSHLLSSGWSVRHKILSSQTRVRRDWVI